MQKPINLKIVEFEDEVVRLINKYNLPAFIIHPVINRILNKVIELEQQQYESSKIEYENSLKGPKKKGCDDNDKH